MSQLGFGNEGNQIGEGGGEGNPDAVDPNCRLLGPSVRPAQSECQGAGGMGCRGIGFDPRRGVDHRGSELIEELSDPAARDFERGLEFREPGPDLIEPQHLAGFSSFVAVELHRSRRRESECRAVAAVGDLQHGDPIATPGVSEQSTGTTDDFVARSAGNYQDVASTGR